MSDQRWNLATCSYREYVPGMGVPLATSVGKNSRLEPQIEVHVLKPFGVFRVLDHLPQEERAKAYQARLDEKQPIVERVLDDLTKDYPEHPLVMLCWCQLAAAEVGPNGCHRRWAANWMHDRYGLLVPELGLVERPRERAPRLGPPTLF